MLFCQLLIFLANDSFQCFLHSKNPSDIIIGYGVKLF